LTLYKSITRY